MIAPRERTALRGLCRLLLVAMVLPGAVAAVSGCVGEAAAPPDRVIWIVIDSLRADHLGYMGYDRPTSPNLDALARESVDFRLAIAPSNVTRRSVTAYMTGKHYSHVHEDPMRIGLPEAEVSLAEAFRAAGFRTVGCVTNYFLRPEEGQAQGFDVYHTLYQYNAPYGTIEEVIATLRERYRRSGGREFVYIHTMDVHHPYRPPLPYGAAHIKPYHRRAVREGNLYNQDGSVVIGNLPYYAEGHDVREEDIEFLMSLYDGVIEYTDARLPELLRVLDYDPSRDLLVITADHGEQFFEHGFWRHGASLTLEELHVPLLVRYDGFPPNRHLGAVSLLDLYPTFCDLFGLERPEGLAGQSLLPALQGGAIAPDRTVYCEAPDGTGPAAAVVNASYLYAVYSDVHYLRPEAVWPFAEFLHDLRADPGCARNVADEAPDAAEAMNAALRGLNTRWRHFTPDVIAGGDHAATFGPDLIAAAWEGMPDLPAPRLTASDGVARFDAPAAETRATARIDAPGAAHVIEIAYRLTSGVLVLELTEEGADQPLWRHECRKPTPAWRTVRRRVYPQGASVRLTLRMSEPGVAEFEAPRLRKAVLPAVPLESPIARGDAVDEAHGLTEEERQRLETLGYLGP